MPLIRTERRDVHGRNGIRLVALHNVFRCQKLEMCRATCSDDASGSRKYLSQAFGAYTNPNRHLLKCLARSSLEYLENKYKEEIEWKTSSFESYFKTCMNKRISPNPKELVVEQYINFIVEYYQLLSIAQ